MCHNKVKCVLGLHTRRLFGRLERDMTTNVILKMCKSNIIVLSHWG